MTATSETPRASNIVQRATNIILRPTAEWERIDGEPATVQGLFTGYAMILAAISPVCSLVGGLLFSSAMLARMGVTLNPVGLVITAVVNYVVALVAVFVFGLVIDGLAPSFGATRDRLRAMKVAVYSSTPAWLCGVFGLIPMLGFLVLLGLYGIFLLYRGQAVLMRAPAKPYAYTAVTVVVMFIVWFVLGAISVSVGAATGATPGFGALLHPPGAMTSVTTTN